MSRDFSSSQYSGVPSTPATDVAERKELEPRAVAVPLDIEISEDIYDMVLVAAFGGIKMDLGFNQEMKPMSAVVHPLYVWGASVCLFFLQIISIFCLRIDMDVNAHVMDDEKGEWHGRILLIMQIVMILVLQVMIYKELLGSLKLLAFLINPTSWTDVKRVEVEGRYKFMRHPAFLVPFPICALIFKCVIGYNICTDSLSVILVCRSVQDVIFNSLAITFIADLDEPFWKMISSIFHLQASSASSFELKPVSPVQYSGFLQCLHRRKGGREIENMVTYTMLWIIYVRQLFIVMFALKTDTLPIARDVCSIFRYSHVRILNFLLSRTVLEEVLVGVDKIANDRLEHCSKSYKLIGMSDILELAKESPVVASVGVGLITALVLGAQVARKILSNSRPVSVTPEGMPLVPDTDSPEDGRVDARQFEELKQEVALLKDALAKLQAAHSKP